MSRRDRRRLQREANKALQAMCNWRCSLAAIPAAELTAEQRSDREEAFVLVDQIVAALEGARTEVELLAAMQLAMKLIGTPPRHVVARQARGTVR